jgi:hypothetical protein
MQISPEFTLPFIQVVEPRNPSTVCFALRTPFKKLILGSGLIHEKGCPLLFYPNRCG